MPECQALHPDEVLRRLCPKEEVMGVKDGIGRTTLEDGVGRSGWRGKEKGDKYL